MARVDKEKKSKICKKSDCIETAEYSCSLELETHSFLIVHADVRHNVGGWELPGCGLGDWELCIRRLGTVWLWIGRLGTVWLYNGSLEGWELFGAMRAWEAGDCLVVQ